MFQNLKSIILNRTRIGAVNFALELLVGILSEYRRANSGGHLDFNVKKSEMDSSRNDDINQIKH